MKFTSLFCIICVVAHSSCIPCCLFNALEPFIYSCYILLLSYIFILVLLLEISSISVPSLLHMLTVDLFSLITLSSKCNLSHLSGLGESAEEKSSTYQGHIQEMSENKGPVDVYIEEIGCR